MNVFKNQLMLCALVFSLCLPSYACKESNTAPNSVKSKTMSTNNPSEDKKEISAIVGKLSADYKSIMGMYDLDMEIFATDRNAYIETYHATLSNMDYMSTDFKDKLMEKLKAQQVKPRTTNLRPLVDPLFEATYPSDGIRIHGFDIEEDMAGVSVQLYDSYDKTLCCFSHLFFDRQDGKWQLTGHDLADVIRDKYPTTIAGDKLIGLYTLKGDATKSYSIKKDGDQFALEYCTPECHDVGIIKEIQVHNVTNYRIIMKGIQGEMIPTYKRVGNQLQVHEYNVASDAWEDNVYELVDAAG